MAGHEPLMRRSTEDRVIPCELLNSCQRGRVCRPINSMSDDEVSGVHHTRHASRVRHGARFPLALNRE
jgi:hypothetical protein